MAVIDCERCRFLQFSKKKYSKTAGFGKCQQADLDFVYGIRFLSDFSCHRILPISAIVLLYSRRKFRDLNQTDQNPPVAGPKIFLP